MKLKLGIAIGFSCFLFGSCGSKVLFEQNQKIEGASWSSKSPSVFEIDIKDTVSGYDFYVNIRNTGNYGYSNLYLFVNTRFPNGQLVKDTIECLMATPEGEWIGSGVGDLHDQSVLIKRAVNFPVSGRYRFEFIQAMREDPLEGIADVGFRVEQMENRK
ncbi:MAG: gliding motility lipoprotein GldH [Bacteroidota bacterium]|jgi:gliding motility-associated lipoprotein GldH